MDFFEKYNIQVDDWPPYSPDLNPIEHFWVELKLRLHMKYPDIGNTQGGPHEVKARLAVVLPEIWEDIPDAYLETLWKSLPDGVAAVIDAKGWYRRHWGCNFIRFFFCLHRHHFKYLDTVNFGFEDCIIFSCSVILIVVARECVCKGAHRPNHQDFCIVTVSGNIRVSVFYIAVSRLSFSYSLNHYLQSTLSLHLYHLYFPVKPVIFQCIPPSLLSEHLSATLSSFNCLLYVLVTPYPSLPPCLFDLGYQVTIG